MLTPWELNLIDVGELLGRASELLKRCNVNFWTMQEGIRVLSHPPPVAACRALHWSHWFWYPPGVSPVLYDVSDSNWSHFAEENGYYSPSQNSSHLFGRNSVELNLKPTATYHLSLSLAKLINYFVFLLCSSACFHPPLSSVSWLIQIDNEKFL